MTQTTDLSDTRRGFDGPHGTVFGQSDAELFGAPRSESPARLALPDDLLAIDEDDRR